MPISHITITGSSSATKDSLLAVLAFEEMYQTKCKQKAIVPLEIVVNGVS